MSSKPWTKQYAVSGLMDTNSTLNPDWCINKANGIWIIIDKHRCSYLCILAVSFVCIIAQFTAMLFRYCSSDSFSANTTASNTTSGWYFRGRVILRSIIETVLPLGLAKAQHVWRDKETTNNKQTWAGTSFWLQCRGSRCHCQSRLCSFASTTGLRRPKFSRPCRRRYTIGISE